MVRVMIFFLNVYSNCRLFKPDAWLLAEHLLLALLFSNPLQLIRKRVRIKQTARKNTSYINFAKLATVAQVGS